MKTFEEKFTAWVDGELKGKELAEFEAELPHALEARLEKLAARQVGDLLREHGRAPELTNADFFNHQLMQQIEAEPVKPAAPARAPRKFAWSLPRLAMAGAFSLLVAFGLYHTAVQQPVTQSPEQQGIVEWIGTGSGDIKSNVVQMPKDNISIVYLNPSIASAPAVKHPSPEKHKDK
jgi:negative regulator of sigma E activity